MHIAKHCKYNYILYYFKKYLSNLHVYQRYIVIDPLFNIFGWSAFFYSYRVTLKKKIFLLLVSMVYKGILVYRSHNS